MKRKSLILFCVAFFVLVFLGHSIIINKIERSDILIHEKFDMLIEENIKLKNKIIELENDNEQIELIIKESDKRIKKIENYFDQDSHYNANDLTEQSHLTHKEYLNLLEGKDFDTDVAKALLVCELKYNVNGIFLLSLASLESNYGRSNLAKSHNNITSYMAYTNNPMLYAKYFDTQADCIETTAKLISQEYLQENGKYNNGSSVKSVNIRYADDKMWAYKINSIAYNQIEIINQ